MRPPRRTPLLALPLGVTLLLLPGQALADPYAAAQQRATELERAGKPGAAAVMLRPLAERFPQDYQLQLRVGWLFFQARDYPRAEVAYRRALDLAPRSLAAQRGLAWTLLRRGKGEPAKAAFAVLLVADPSNKQARQGLALATAAAAGQPALRLTVDGDAEVALYQGHPDKASAQGGTVVVDALLWERVRLRGRYRFTRFRHLPQLEPLLGTDQSQHEAYFSAGARLWRLQLTARYGLISAESVDLVHQWGLGLGVALGSLGHVAVDGSASAYADMNVWRVLPRYRLTLARRTTLELQLQACRAAAAAPHPQLFGATAETLLSGTLALGFRAGWAHLYGGLRLGTSVRPTDLALGWSANGYDRVGAGFFLGVEASVTRTTHLLLSYAASHLDTPLPMGQAVQQSTLHQMTLGVRWGS